MAEKHKNPQKDTGNGKPTSKKSDKQGCVRH